MNHANKTGLAYETHNFSPVLLTDLIMKSFRSETGSRCAMQAFQQCIDVNMCWVTRRRNTTEPNQEAASGEITALCCVGHSTEREALTFINKAGVFRQKEKAGHFDLIYVNVKHFVAAYGKKYSELCSI